MIRVVDVRGLRSPEQRATVVYVGRGFAGWPASEFGNPYKPAPSFDAVKAYRGWLERWEAQHPTEFQLALRKLWESTEHGAKPLGCWCGKWDTNSPPQAEFCHAIVLAKLLKERFAS